MQQKVIQNLSLPEVHQVIQQHMNPEEMICVVVGDKTTQLAGLENLGMGPPILVSKYGFEVIEERP